MGAKLHLVRTVEHISTIFTRQILHIATRRNSDVLLNKPPVAAFRRPRELDLDFLEHLRYENLPEPEPPWDD